MQRRRYTVLLTLMVLAGLANRGFSREAGNGSSGSPVAIPVCLYPPVDASGIRIHPTLMWTGVAQATAYVIECAGDSQFTRILACDTTDAEPIARLRPELPHGMNVHWRVAVVDSMRALNWSLPSRFTTAPPLAASPISFAPTRRNEETEGLVWVRIPVRGGVRLEWMRRSDTCVSTRTLFPWMTGERDSVPLIVRFRPVRYGMVHDTLILQSDHGDCRIALSGDSPAPMLRASASVCSLGIAAVTDTALLRIALRNDTAINDAMVKRVRTRTPFFSVAIRGVGPVAPADSLLVTARFHPRLPKGEIFGAFGDTLIVEYDGGVERVTLVGESPPPRPLADVTLVDFGEIAAQDTGVAHVRIANGSINALRVDSVQTRRGAFAAPRTRASIRLPDTLSIPVRFSSGGHGWFRDTLVVYNNSWRGPVRIPMRAYVPYPLPELSAENLDFGVVPFNDTTSIELRVGNASPSFLRVDSIRTRYRRFSLSTPSLPFVVLRGDSLRIRVHFRPDSARSAADTLLIVTNGRERVLRVPVAGTGSATAGGWATDGSGGDFALYQNFPNPFNASTTFRYAVPVASRVRLEMFTTIGQSVAVLVDGIRDAGRHDVVWHADVPSGMYYCRFSASPLSNPGGTYVGTRKVVVVR